MEKCSINNSECSGEVHAYEYRLGTAEEIALEDEEYNLGKIYSKGIMFGASFCETHKKGEILIKKPMRPSLPYQGIARSALRRALK